MIFRDFAKIKRLTIKNMSKFTMDEMEDLEDGFFEWTQNSIEPQ